MLIYSAIDFGNAVRSARRRLGLSQAQLAERCRCSQRFVSQVERGKATAELGKALELLVALGTPLQAGGELRPSDGRAEVDYAVVRIAESLTASPRKRRPLASYLEEDSRGRI